MNQTLTELKLICTTYLQNAIQTVGPIPDSCGNGVRQIMSHDNPHQLWELSYRLLRATETRSYDTLVHYLVEPSDGKGSV